MLILEINKLSNHLLLLDILNMNYFLIYNLDIQGFRTTVSEKNPFMLDSVVNTMPLDVLLAAEMGHTRAGNQFGVNEINTYSEVVLHAEIENRY